ncbi:hypothetical protein A2U01_0026773 [Trifolium medium]|uniref:Uncharacterized protein n=1 Tax=Trifolium medium TaxID=97028 RepID=A0A392P2J4_9FABA|nr:hypothetical protein [Trifolium medium]
MLVENKSFFLWAKWTVRPTCSGYTIAATATATIIIAPGEGMK